MTHSRIVCLQSLTRTTNKYRVTRVTARFRVLSVSPRKKPGPLCTVERPIFANRSIDQTKASPLSGRINNAITRVVLLTEVFFRGRQVGHVIRRWTRKLCNHGCDIRESYVPSGVASTCRRFIFMGHSFNQAHINNACAMACDGSTLDLSTISPTRARGLRHASRTFRG